MPVRYALFISKQGLTNLSNKVGEHTSIRRAQIGVLKLTPLVAFFAVAACTDLQSEPEAAPWAKVFASPMEWEAAFVVYGDPDHCEDPHAVSGSARDVYPVMVVANEKVTVSHANGELWDRSGAQLVQ